MLLQVPAACKAKRGTAMWYTSFFGESGLFFVESSLFENKPTVPLPTDYAGHTPPVAVRIEKPADQRTRKHETDEKGYI